MDAPRALCFGTFDGLDAGHAHFLASAAAACGFLFVSVARDAHVHALKRKSPMHGEGKRLEAVRRFPAVAGAALSDEELGTYGIIRAFRPDLLVLGHDQDALAADIRRWMEKEDLTLPIRRIRCANLPDLD